MRFSLKWILTAAVYVAIAAAAFSQSSWVYAELLWVASLLAFVFAALLAMLTRGKARVMAAGFLLSSVCFLFYLTAASLLGNNSTPATRLLIAAGFQQFPQLPFYYTPVSPAPQPYLPVAPPAVAPYPATPMPAMAPPVVSLVAPPVAAPVDFAQYVRAANAVGMMLFGMLGVLIGLAAQRTATASADRDTRIESQRV